MTRQIKQRKMQSQLLESFQRFPVEISYMPEVMKRSSLAHQIDKIVRKDSQEKAEKSWLERNAESVELVLEDNDSEEDRVKKYRQNKAKSQQLNKLQQELNTLLSKPLQSKTFSKRFLAGAGVSPLLQHQFEELARQKLGDASTSDQNKRQKLVVIGQDCVEPLQALRTASKEVYMNKGESKGKSYNRRKVKYAEWLPAL
ncbi:UNVERIFIED_CONTAM: DEAD-box ATP-dependent RNA helicase 13 [Sesamum radiatum]|uniref:DEAD-box ATP-dependent RNA helicase 13 n=1 Tax=Sesamum radiatum TaxID=300843 RepID=A0AAW2UB71_SESRA